MSCLKNYIFDTLSTDYLPGNTLSKTAFTTIESFEHKSLHNKIVLISSLNRNDHIYRALKKVKSINLPTIFDVCSDDDYLYILEEYIEGKTLFEAMKNEQFSVEKSCKYMSDVCNGLTKMHNIGIIHRDITPSNIIIKPDNTAVLIDFNISRLISEKKKNDTQNLGTIGYAAPEQFGITQSSKTTDIHPIGVILNELILGVHPTVDVPKGKIGKIINRCTTMQMSKRYRSVSELKKELDKLKFK